MNSSQTSSFYEFEGFVLDPLQRTLRTLADDQPVRLTARAFDALYLLVSRHGQLVDKDTLMKALWPKVVVEENNLSQVIYTLRQFLGEKPGEHRFIATAAGRGYQFVAPVKEISRQPASVDTGAKSLPEEKLAQEIPVSAASRPSDAISGRARVSRSLLGWSTVVLALLAGGVWWAIEYRMTATKIMELATTAPAISNSSVAVLPFANLTGDASKDYLGDGMANELILTLAKVPGLKVPARTSTFAYKGRNTDIRQIAKDLGVDTILEGSVSAAGKRIRITAELINAQDGLHLWSESYDEEFTDLFQLQDTLVTQIVRALHPNLSGATQVTVAQAPPTKDIEAYNLYLQGESLTARQNVPELNQALAYLKQAIARDPKFARAYVSMAMAHRSLLSFGNREEHLAASNDYAHKALALDPNLADAHLVLAIVAASQGQYVQAEVESRKAVALAPNDGFIQTTYGVGLAWTGRTGQSISAIQTALALAPADPMTNAFATRIFTGAGRDAQAKQHEQALRAMGYPMEGIVRLEAEWLRLLHAGRYAEAEKIFAQIIGLNPLQRGTNPTYEVSRLVHDALTDPVKREAAIAASARLYPKAGAKPDPIKTFGVRSCMWSGLMFGLIKANDAAYELLDRCLDAGWFQMAPVVWLAELREFRQDSRFHALAARLGFIELFQQYGPPDDCALPNGRLVCH